MDFFDRVWEVVGRIPEGRVTTYGHIARHLGLGRSARLVGHALHAVGRAGPRADHLPCHRVVNRTGALTGALSFPTPTYMEERLQSEGVTFLPDGRVDLERHLWDPAAG